MRKTYGILCLLLLWIITTGHAQRVVRGVVQVASNKTALPGVVVLVKGTRTGASTDMQGSFQLASLRDTITLVFSSVGFERLEKKIILTQDTTTLLPIRLKEECSIDFFYHKHVELSLLSGVRYTPLGGRIQALYPYLIKTRHGQGHLRAEFSYQFGTDNYQHNGTLALGNAFINCDNNVDITTSYQSVRLAAQKFSYTRYTIGATYTGKLVGREIPVYLAIGNLSYSAEEVSATKIGVEAGFNYPFFIYLNSSCARSMQLAAIGRIAYWQDYWQFRSGLEAQIKRFSAGVDFNKLGQYAEINTRVGFKIERRYHAKKLD
ncbi:MAG TPA: carboxypeptidase-like regulatory domain-containing protein [Hymenobacter sp.]|uniref:carboxypeptidase-like regulatory domain-containing protein n=1 Tax=Hymenobacter sp. TaxID=1898978 RepID=UPI002D7F3904|nr:carboxypeptidase-like regulatory domain-containing protein [Hymenobacter sp.]HET9506278.1 carboxypeptidase-like regulatory domain-containing protein [Hymenobacter sp.]